MIPVLSLVYTDTVYSLHMVYMYICKQIGRNLIVLKKLTVIIS